MALTKVEYIDYQTRIVAANLNAIQDSIIALEGHEAIEHSLAYCTTAADGQAKLASLANFVLYIGARIAVKFTYTNTASQPTLNVNSTGAKAIMQYGTTAVGTTEATSWVAGDVVTLIYDGTNWVIQGREANGKTVIKKTISSFSTLPQTVSDARIAEDMECIGYYASNQSAIASDWTVTTASGSLTVAGTISGSTTLTLYLAKIES